MKKIALAILIMLLGVACAFGQEPQFDWTIRMENGSDYDPRHLLVDSVGNIYISGVFNYTMDFDPDPFVAHTLTSQGVKDMYVAKYSAQGELLWVLQYSPIYNYEMGVIDMELTPEGDVYVLGYSTHSQGSNVFYYFIKRISNTGLLQSNFTYYGGGGNPGKTYINDFAISRSGAIYVTGRYREDYPANTSHIVLKKIVADSIVWETTMSGSQNNEVGGRSITIDSLGNIYYSGTYSGITDFDPGPGTENLSGSGNNFICKLDSLHNFIWAKKFGDDECFSSSLKIDQVGNVIYQGNLWSSGYFNPNGSNYLSSLGHMDVIILKLDQNGNFVWVRQFGSTENEYSWGLEVDAYNNIYSCGGFSLTVDFDPGVGSFDLTSSGFMDAYVLKLDPMGNFIWVYQAGGTYDDYCFSMAISNANNVCFTGNGRGDVDFDPGFGISNISSPYTFGFLSKFTQPHSTGANFYASSSIVYNSESISFYDISTGNPSAWHWDFGDGTTDTVQHPVHNFQNPGTYTISLGVSNGITSDTLVKVDYISVNVQYEGPVFESALLFPYMSAVNYAVPKSLSVDPLGNIISTGKFTAEIDFDPGASTAALSTTSQYDYDIYISKLNSIGEYEWAYDIGGLNTASTANNNSMVVDQLGNLYFAGGFNGNVDFDPGPGVCNLYQPATGGGQSDIFILKLSSSGTFIWAKAICSTSKDEAECLVLDSDGNIYITGYYGATCDFDPGNGSYIMQGSGYADAFILKLDSGGNFIWAKNVAGAGTDFARSAVVDSNDNIYVAGAFEGSVDFDPGPSFSALVANNQDVFVLKLDSAGEFNWAVNLDASLSNSSSIDIDSFGNLYLTGYFNDTVDFDPGPDTCLLVSNGVEDIFICKLDGAGILQWACNVGGNINDELSSLTIDASGNTYTQIRYFGIVDLNPGAGTYYANSNDFGASALIKTDSDGNFIWGCQLEAPPSCHLVKENDNLYFTGPYYNNWDLDPGTGTFTFPSNGIYISKLSQHFGADFTASSANVNLWDTIHFYDLSTQLPTTWHWDFGDGTTDSVQNPSHIYQDTGTYTVVLIASNNNYSDTITKTNYIHVLNPINQQVILLIQGWSIISTYIDPLQNNIDTIFSIASSQMVLMKDESGYVFWPAFNLNLIGQLTIGKAYQIKMLSQQSLTITGTQVDPANTSLNIPAGWSLLGYLRSAPGDISILMSSIASEITIVKNGDGFVFWPAFNVNTIGNMVPGQGYQIKMGSQQTYTYPANSVNVKSATSTVPTTSRILKNTGSNMTLGLQTNGLKAEQEILVYSQSGLLVGAGIVEDNFTAITLWGDDETTPEMDGLLDGEVFTVKLSGEEETIVEIEAWIEGDGKYETNKIAIAGVSSNFQFHVSNFQLYQNIPNPFTLETEISFFLPVDCLVELNIFNLVGERVSALISEEITKGRHSIKFNSTDLPAGTYFYRLKTPEFEKTRKMVLLK